jgi:archaellum component FlaC
MSNEERVIMLSRRINDLVDELHLVKSDINDFKNKVSKDIKLVIEQVRRNAN